MMMNQEDASSSPQKYRIIWIAAGATIGVGLAILASIAVATSEEGASATLGLEEWLMVGLLLAIGWLLYLAPKWITRPPSKRKPDGPEVAELLADPHFSLGMMRFQIGGTIAGLMAILLAIWGLYQAIGQSKVADQALTDQRISTAWQILAQTEGGVIGRAYAVDVLANETEEVLLGMDLGCGDEEEHNGKEKCLLPVQFVEREYGSSEAGRTEVWESDFSFAHMRNVIFENITFNNVRFNAALFEDVRFRDVQGERVSFTNVVAESPVLMDYVAFDDVIFGVGGVGTTITNSTFLKAQFLPSSGPVLLRNVQLLQIDFSDVPLYANTFRFAADDPHPFAAPGVYRDVRLFADHDPLTEDGLPAEGTRPMKRLFNITGATLCAEVDETETPVTQCWQHANQDFFDHAWYFAKSPPMGIELLPTEVSLRIGCEVPRRTVGSTEAEIFEGDCIDGDLQPISELFAQPNVANPEPEEPI